MSEKCCSEVRATVQRFMDPVSVCLNLWASQRIFKAGGGSGFVHWAEVFPGVPLDEDGQVVPDPPHPREGVEQNPRQDDRSDELYGATLGKYRSVPRWDWTTLSACEVVEWSLGEFTGDSDSMRALLVRVHPDSGRFMPDDYPKDPFVAAARHVLDKGASWADQKALARVSRSSYGAFRRVVRLAVGSQTSQDELGKIVERERYLRLRRSANAAIGKEIAQSLATRRVESAS